MYRVMICDDVAQHAEELRQMLTEELVTVEGIFASPAQLHKALSQGNKPDILFMDIEMEDQNGVNVVKECFSGDGNVQIIYVTGYSRYCTQVYETEHVSFLLKPVKRDELHFALGRATARLKEYYAQSLVLKDQKNLYTIPFADILWLESQAHKVTVCTQERQITTYGKLNEMLEQLDRRFFQCHKSYIVNLDQVADLNKAEFTLKNGTCIPISVRLRSQAYEVFLRHMQCRLRERTIVL